MAVTPTELQDALGRTAMSPRVLRSFGVNGTIQEWYIWGGATVPGRLKHLRTTAADDASTQAAAVLTALRAGPA